MRPPRRPHAGHDTPPWDPNQPCLWSLLKRGGERRRTLLLSRQVAEGIDAKDRYNSFGWVCMFQDKAIARLQGNDFKRYEDVRV